MKPWQIGLLVVVGGIAGGLVVKVTERSQPPAPAVAAAPSQAPVTQPAPPAVEPDAASEPAAPPQVSAKPKPFHSEKPVTQPDPAPVAPAPVSAAAPSANSVPVPTPAPEAQTASVAVTPTAPPSAAAVLPPPPPPPPRQVTLNAGTSISVRLIDSLSTERNHPGDLFSGTLDQPLVVEDLVIAERGARVEGMVMNTDPGGRTRGVASLTLQLTRIHLSDGQTVTVGTDNFERKAEATHGTDAAKVGGGAIIGAAIGAIAGGGKGAAIGAGVGGGAGAGDVLLTRGKPATLASESKISFRLSAPVTVTERR